MELAIPFKFYNKEYNDIAAEFNINYNEEHNDKEKMPGFVEQWSDKRINLNTQNFDLELFKQINKLHPDFALRLTSEDQLEWIPALKENNISFFFDPEAISVSSLYTLNYLIELGVSDVYIANDLFYNLPQIYQIIHDHGIKTRWIFNRIATTVPIQETAKAPWIPPDATEIVEPYIDIYEFDCGDPYDWHKFDVYYDAWIKNQDWYGNLQEIILGLNIFVPENSLMGYDWIKYKTQCNFKCVRKDALCKKCLQYVEIADKLNEKHIALNRDHAEDGQEEEKSD